MTQYFNIDRIKDCKDKSKHENLITAFCFKRQNEDLTGVPPTSSTCSDYLSTSFSAKHDTTKTYLNDHYTVVGEKYRDFKNSQENRNSQQTFFETSNQLSDALLIKGRRRMIG